MVTYSDLIQTGILVVGLLGLIVQITEATALVPIACGYFCDRPGDYRLSGSTHFYKKYSAHVAFCQATASPRLIFHSQAGALSMYGGLYECYLQQLR